MNTKRAALQIKFIVKENDPYDNTKYYIKEDDLIIFINKIDNIKIYDINALNCTLFYKQEKEFMKEMILKNGGKDPTKYACIRYGKKYYDLTIPYEQLLEYIDIKNK